MVNIFLTNDGLQNICKKKFKKKIKLGEMKVYEKPIKVLNQYTN